ncbi:MAG: hypothetical protein HY078_01790 [Elusimicrobia bacterium]|nr:hypothetical protein [Elusimicrobiota bacterium]
MSQDWGRRIGDAKAIIDNGFTRIGPTLKAEDEDACKLARCAGRLVRLANAVALLCKNGHASDCLTLVEGMSSLGLLMRVGLPSEYKTQQIHYAGLNPIGWTTMKNPNNPELKESIKRSGLTSEEIDFFASAFTTGASKWSLDCGGLPWSHAIPREPGLPVSSEEVLKIAARAMSQAIRALDVRWPGSFSGAEALWS